MTGMIPSLFYLYVFGQSQLAKVKEKRAGRKMKMKVELLLFVKNGITTAIFSEKIRNQLFQNSFLQALHFFNIIINIRLLLRGIPVKILAHELTNRGNKEQGLLPVT